MKRYIAIFIFAVLFCNAVFAQKKTVPSKTHFAAEALQPYVDDGRLAGAAIVEVITGMKWEDYLKKEVLDPLGMKDTWFWPTDRQIKSHIEMYETFKDKPAAILRAV